MKTLDDTQRPGGIPAYYPAIDSLRAFAVLAVLAYHLDSRWLPGGFVGVDVFFVISGFVVTLSMAKARDMGLVALVTTFYARRVLRIAPALVVCLLVTSIVTSLFVPIAWLSEANATTALAAFFGMSNLVLAARSNAYFSPRAEFNPFTHTWSLGVEEQFYLVFPLLLFFFLRGSKRRAWWLLTGVSAASLACCAWWSSAQPSFAFYLIPARFWELGCGVGLFMAIDRWRPLMSRQSAARARVAVYVLLAGLAASVLIVRPQGFPYPWALLPVLCTTGLIGLIVGRGDSVFPRWVTAMPLVWIGKISYSLYLWHWPVLVLFRWTIGLESGLAKALALALSFLLATLSYRYVELPLRNAGKVRRAPRGLVVGAGLATVAVAAGMSWTVFQFQERISLSVTRHADVWLPTGPVRAGGLCEMAFTYEQLAGGAKLNYKPIDCVKPDSSSRLFVAGDSHAQAYSAMLREYAARSGRELVILGMGGCGFLGLLHPMSEDPAYCRTFTAATWQLLRSSMRPGDVLFLPSLRVPRFADQWGGNLAQGTVAEKASARQRASAEAVPLLKDLSARGILVVFDAPKPVFKAPPFRCADWFNAANPVCAPGFDLLRSEMEQVRAPMVATLVEVSAQVQGSTVWDPLPALCPAATCSAYAGGRPLFFDGDHLSNIGNAALVDSFIDHLRTGSLSARPSDVRR